VAPEKAPKSKKAKGKTSKTDRASKKTKPKPKKVAEVPGVGPELVKMLKEGGPKSRLDQIRESHALLRQFTPKELKVLMNLKRNTSSKAWTLREDLVVLTLPMSNREIAEILTDRNKEAVKKRLQLLRSKGLTKRNKEPG
jgi:hypothetical protein